MSPARCLLILSPEKCSTHSMTDSQEFGEQCANKNLTVNINEYNIYIYILIDIHLINYRGIYIYTCIFQ